MPSHILSSLFSTALRSIAVYSITQAVSPIHVCLFNHCGSKNFLAFFLRGEPLSCKSLAPLARSMILLIKSLCKDAKDVSILTDGLYSKVTGLQIGAILGLECRP